MKVEGIITKKVIKLIELKLSFHQCRKLSKNVLPYNFNNNNNNTNTNNNVYGAVIMTQSLREFTRFIWRTQHQRQNGRRPSDQANRPGLRVRL